jgi:glycerophosphoryl diester phosphodiesterase
MVAALLIVATQPIVIAHRGASGLRPEHTLEAYRLGIEQGADYIEPDLVLTKDGVLVARHENEISGTTDVATKPEFADRKRTKTIDGRSVTGWFTEDFTLAELKTLRCRERLPQIRRANTAWDGKFPIPTFQEVIDLAKAEGKRLGRPIGVYPETKHPSYFARIGLPFDVPLLQVLDANGWNRADAPVFIQSFEVGNLKALRSKTRVRLVQLLDSEGRPADAETPYAEMARPEGLRAIRAYADGIGPAKSLVLPKADSPTSLVRDAKAAGLLIHVWTLRDEPVFVLPGFSGKASEEARKLFELGVDGVFADFPATAVSARIGSRVGKQSL